MFSFSVCKRFRNSIKSIWQQKKHFVSPVQKSMFAPQSKLPYLTLYSILKLHSQVSMYAFYGSKYFLLDRSFGDQQLKYLLRKFYLTNIQSLDLSGSDRITYRSMSLIGTIVPHAFPHIWV